MFSDAKDIVWPSGHSGDVCVWAMTGILQSGTKVSHGGNIYRPYFSQSTLGCHLPAVALPFRYLLNQRRHGR